MAGKSKGKIELQVEVKNQSQWDELMTKEGLIVVDAYAAWCGPCKAIVSSLKRLKNEIGDDLLHFATAETDSIDTLEKYRMKSQPTFLFYAAGQLRHALRGCNCPILMKCIKQQLDKEHKAIEHGLEREIYIDNEVETALEPEVLEKKDEEKEIDEEEEEIVQLPKQITVAIIKPDAVKAGYADEIIEKLEESGWEVHKKEERTLSKEEATEFYKQHEGADHFEQLVEFMISGPCMTMVLSKAGETLDTAHEGVITEFRDFMGPKDVNVAKEDAPDSLRAKYGTDSMMNAIHGCDSSESAARELAFFFPDFAAPTVVGKRKKKRLQRTLAIIRPDALRDRKDSILNKIEEAGFTIAMSKEVMFTKEQAEDFYVEHKEQDFFDTLVSNMTSGPMLALCLAREDAVEGWRELLGPKEIHIAQEEAPESLRAQFQVEDSPINPLHGSDSTTTAHQEIQKIFPLQSTLAVIKPDTEPEQKEEIIQRIREAGFKISLQKEVTLTKELAGQFYHEHEGKEFFSGLTDYMSSGTTQFLVLSREDAISGLRTLMGPTDPEEAKDKAPESLRAQFGVDVMKNVVHGSSSTDKAGEIIKTFFPEVEVLPDGTVKVPEPEKSKEVAVEESVAQPAEEPAPIKEDASTAEGAEQTAEPENAVAADEVSKVDGEAKPEGEPAGEPGKEVSNTEGEAGPVEKTEPEDAVAADEVSKVDGEAMPEGEPAGEPGKEVSNTEGEAGPVEKTEAEKSEGSKVEGEAESKPENTEQEGEKAVDQDGDETKADGGESKPEGGGEGSDATPQEGESGEGNAAETKNDEEVKAEESKPGEGTDEEKKDKENTGEESKDSAAEQPATDGENKPEADQNAPPSSEEAKPAEGEEGKG